MIPNSNHKLKHMKGGFSKSYHCLISERFIPLDKSIVRKNEEINKKVRV